MGSLFNTDWSKMWIKVWITIFVLGFAYGKNFDTCPGGPTDFCEQGYNCFLPDCVCSGTEPDVPDVKDRPQIVYLTFDDAMTKEFDDGFYTELFLPDQTGEYKFKNPNGCPIRSTFFVTAKSNEFDVTHKYWRYGNEIAAHSITHRSSTTYWSNINTTEWEAEMYGVKQMIHRYASVPYDDIIGVRTPYLQSGGDEMFQMMMDKGFEYDSLHLPNYLDTKIWPMEGGPTLMIITVTWIAKLNHALNVHSLVFGVSLSWILKMLGLDYLMVRDTHAE